MKTDNMSERDSIQKHSTQELLSALIDGQLDQKQTQEVLDMLLKDEELQAQWQAMHQVSSIYQNKLSDPIIQGDISSQVSQQIDKEPAHFVEDAVALDKPQINRVDWHDRSAFFKAGVGIAIAASVMFVTLNISQLLNQTAPTGAPTEQMADTQQQINPSIRSPIKDVAESQNNQQTAPAYVATQLSESARMPFAQTATFSQFDNVSGQTVSNKVSSFERKQQYPLSADKVIELKPFDENESANEESTQSELTE